MRTSDEHHDAHGAGPAEAVDRRAEPAGAVCTTLLAAVAALICAVPGGRDGLRFHHEVDPAGFGR